jgi:beta-mannosidase
MSWSKIMNHISLAGEWQVTWTGGQHGGVEQFLQPVQDPARYTAFTFPGSIHRNLEQMGLIDDPRLGVNALKARWVEEQYWILRREFEVPENAVGLPAFLHIEVMDGVAQVCINNEKVGDHWNAHRPAVIDLSGKLRSGKNEITILLESGLFAVADLPGKDYTRALETILNKRHQLRQAQYQFGWDWNPRLIYLGLHGVLEVVWGAQPWLKQVTVLGEVDEDLQAARIRVRPLFHVNGENAVPVTLRLHTAGGIPAAAEVVLQPGEDTEEEVALEISQPRLWWPRGHGEPHLYPLTLEVEMNGEEVAHWEGRTGLRRVALARSPHPEVGEYLHLLINNRPVFCKGANWVPPELSGHEVPSETIVKLVSLAEQENMNMLRLWGGGVWANHTLLELCDERGIMVWHDLLFACAKYPADRPDFLAEVEREVAWGIRAFSPHPSLVVWAGNNELEVGLWEWNYKGYGRTAPDLVLFHHIFPTLMARLDPTRPYWPSSPYSSPTVPANDPTIGDQHPWGVSLGADDINFWAYRNYVDRFPNEGGVLGCAPADSLRRFLPEEMMRIRSFDWEHHDNTIMFWKAEPGLAYRAVSHWLGQDPQAMSVEDYAFASGLLQAEGIKEYILNYRRRWPSTGSAIYWMFNDSWPTVHGWGTFDYYLNRKLSFFPVRRAFADQVVVAADEGDVVGIYVVNDTSAVLSAQVVSGFFAPGEQGDIAEDLFDVEVPPFTSLRVKELGRDPQQVYYAVLRQGDRSISQDRLLLRPFQEWKYVLPAVQVEEITLDGQQFARYTSSSWVWAVVLDPDGLAELPDDVFDLLPGIPYDLPLKTGQAPPPVLRTGNGLIR